MWILNVQNKRCFNSRLGEKAFSPRLPRMPHCHYRRLAGAADAGAIRATLLPSRFRLSLVVLFNRTANQNPRRAAQRANLQQKATLHRPPEIPDSSHKVNWDKQMKCLKTATGPCVAGVPWAIPHRSTTLWAMPRERFFKNPFPWFTGSQEHETSACIEMNIGTFWLHPFLIS